MKVDRWVLPPAVLVAVFSTVAIAPPVGPAPRGLRVEGLPTKGQSAWLVRAAIEYAGPAGGWSVPVGGTVTLRDASGQGAVTSTLEGFADSTWAFASVATPGPGPWRFVVRADGLEADERLAPSARSAIELPRDGELRERDARSDLVARVEGGVLVPEVPTRVLLRLGAAAAEPLGSWRFEATDALLSLEPTSPVADACGIYELRALAHGFDAHLIARDAQGTVRARRQLPLRPGVVVPFVDRLDEPVDGASLRLRAVGPVAGQVIYALFGDHAGEPLTWRALRLSRDDTPVATYPLPGGTAWVLVSSLPSFEGARTAWVHAPGAHEAEPACATDRATAERYRAFVHAGLSTVTAPRPVRLFDGASIAARAYEARRVALRTRAALLALAALVALAAVMLVESFARVPDEVRALSIARWRRVLSALVSVALLALAGVLLFGTYVLRR